MNTFEIKLINQHGTQFTINHQAPSLTVAHKWAKDHYSDCTLVAVVKKSKEVVSNA